MLRSYRLCLNGKKYNLVLRILPRHLQNCALLLAFAGMVSQPRHGLTVCEEGYSEEYSGLLNPFLGKCHKTVVAKKPC